MDDNASRAPDRSWHFLGLWAKSIRTLIVIVSLCKYSYNLEKIIERTFDGFDPCTHVNLVPNVLESDGFKRLL